MNRPAKTWIPYVIALALLIASAAIRVASYPVVSADYVASLSHWMAALRGSPGLTAFQHPFSDYAPLYLYLLKGLTLLPGYDLYWIKTLSLLFDMALALVIVLLARRSGRGYSGRALFLIFAIVLAVPTVMMNSSLWGQCDSIFATFVLLTLLFMLKDRPVWAMAAFGLAISFKLQAVFLGPVVLGYLLTKKQWGYIFILPAVFAATIVPAALSGGPFWYMLFTYLRQAGEFQQLSLSAPTVFSFVPAGVSPAISTILSVAGYLVAASIAFVLVVLTKNLIDSYGRSDPGDPGDSAAYATYQRRMIFLGLLSVLAVPFFLPHMHDRYFYLADVISVAYAVFEPKRWYIAAIIVISSSFAYMPFLSGQVPLFSRLYVDLAYFGAALLVLILGLIPIVLRISRESRMPREAD
ncbi:MAG: DUF2029 domain-containing protein [Patescibacteria group bacterium]|nr:DUF2029 domain-containing protein [Patescibacteria group bacterium]MDE1941230.1 DUF2029 domain-containing protein [Patescibacteria group bacterium]MDE1966660.1 DUF2029 domain-containing protein [Patescibacteria group bacterium]